jgi:hypothetical protein
MGQQSHISAWPNSKVLMSQETDLQKLKIIIWAAYYPAIDPVHLKIINILYVMKPSH